MSTDRCDSTPSARNQGLAGVVFSLAFAACAGELDPDLRLGAGGTGGGGGTVACDAPAMIFMNSSYGCSNPICHGGSTPPDLSDPNVGTTLRGMKADAACMSLTYINPVDPPNSALVRAVTGTTCGGTQMPVGGLPISQEHVTCLIDWISKMP